MTRASIQATPSFRPGGRIAGIPFVLLALLVAVIVVAPCSARAQPESDEPAGNEPADDTLYQALIAGKSDGDWRGALNRIWKQKEAGWKGRYLGRLFRDPQLRDSMRKCAAYAAAYCADNPLDKDGTVLLATGILHRAHGDDTFVEALRAHLTAGDGGWNRLLDHAREELNDAQDGAVRRASIWFLAREDGEQRPEVRVELLELARAESTAPPPEGRTRNPADAVEILDALDHFLGYRFADLDSAVKKLDELKDLDLPAVILALSRLKDGAEAPLHVRLVDYGKRLLVALASDKGPGALLEFLDPARTPYADVRWYAMEHAAQLDPKPDAAWRDLLLHVLSTETDQTVLGGALTLLESTAFAEVPDLAEPLSKVIATRLSVGGTAPGRGKDDATPRVRMARLLGSLKVRPPAFDALLEADGKIEDEVFAELIRSLGGMPDVPTAELLEIYRSHASESDRDLLARVAVVDSLGRTGSTTNGGDPHVAAALGEIITGEGEEGVGRSENAEVRQHAIRSLGAHPGQETAATLQSLAGGDSDAEARAAIVVLRSTAAGDVNALGALGLLARNVEMPQERRVLALDALASLGDGKECCDVGAAHAAVRDVLASDADETVRLPAARAAAALGDPLSLDPMLAFWKEAPEGDRHGALTDLIVTLAAKDAAHDAILGGALDLVREVRGGDEAERIASGLLADHPRDPLRLVLARLLYQGSEAGEGADDSRRAQLSEAARLLEDVLGASPEADPLAALPLHVRVLRRLGSLTEDLESRIDSYLEAMRRATLSQDRETATAGLAIAQELDEPALEALLDEEERNRLKAYRGVLETRLR